MELSIDTDYMEKLERSIRKGKRQKPKIKDGKRPKRKIFILNPNMIMDSRSDDNVMAILDEIYEEKEREFRYKLNGWYEDDDDEFGIMEAFLNGSTGCPDEDRFIAIYGHHSSLLW